MGGWGTGSFDNDDAQDFLRQLKSCGLDDLKQILTRAADEREYIEAPEASVAIAAAEVVAALKGAPSEAAPHEIQEWVDKVQGSSTSHLNELARRAVEKLRVNSELKDLWLEAEGLNEWSAVLRDLEQRLGHGE